MENRIVEKFVRIVALDPLYTRVSFDFAAPKDEKGRFVTGQESILTEKQMTGEDAITKAVKDKLSMGDDPYIINPDEIYPLYHARKFDLSYEVDKNDNIVRYVNAKDYAEFNFFAVQREVIRDRKTYQRGKHFFYIEDKQKEAEHKVTLEDLIYDAVAFVREGLSIKRLKDIAMLLSHLSPNFTINVDTLSITRLQARLYDACKTMPETVLACQGDGPDGLNHEKLFALKCIKLKQIQLYKGSYYYGINRDSYIGDSFSKVLGWIGNAENSSQVERLGSLVKQFDDKPVE